MYPLSIALAIENSDLWDQVQACLKPLAVRVAVEQRDASNLGPLFERAQRMPPDVLLLDITKRREPLEDLVQTVRALAPEAMIIALNTSADAETILSSLRAGVNEYLYPPLQGSLNKALERKSQECSRRREDERPGGKTLAFFSAKGGCGATTIAVHVAVELGRRGQKALLVDLDLEAGLIAFLLKTKSPYSILDAANNLHRLDASYWKALVSNGIPNLEIMPAPSTLAAKHQVLQQQLRHVLAFVRTQYDCSIVDLGRSLTRVTMEALEEIDEACLVTTLEIPALHQAKQIVQTLLDSGYSRQRIRLILNRVPKRVDVTPDELEKMLGVPIHCTVPNDFPELYDCYAEGRLLARNSNLGKHIARLAAKLVGIEDDSPKRKFSLFG
ncbi:MAG TPA: AAA family ATPase [Bryobacteraceae bacterium]|nr:AAA family ATPase [Bryobacteraceae bacterium]